MKSRERKPPSPLRLLKRLLTAPVVLVAAVIILIEDWLWDDLARLAAAIGRLPVFRLIETAIAGLPPYLALACFGLPTLLLVPVKLAALYFISHGKATLGLLTVIGAKVVGTAMVARIFALTKPKLMRIKWLAWLYERFTTFKARVYGAIKGNSLYRFAHIKLLRLRLSLKLWLGKRRGFLRRRWGAALRLSKRRKQPQA
jgi:hypothetical protein